MKQYYTDLKVNMSNFSFVEKKGFALNLTLSSLVSTSVDSLGRRCGSYSKLQTDIFILITELRLDIRNVQK